MGKGRPKLNGNSKYKRMSFRADDALYNSILHYSQVKDIDLSDALRELLSIGIYQYFIENPQE